VEEPVGGGDRDDVADLTEALDVLDRLLEPSELLFAEERDCGCDGLRLEQVANPVGLDQLVRIEARDEVAAVRRVDNLAFGFERLQSLSDRNDAQSELTGNRLLEDLVARAEPAGRDPSLNVHKGGDAVEHAARVLRTLRLEGLWLEPTGSLPVGHRRQVELARALALSPNVVLLDEVMAGMSHEEVEGVREIVRTLQGFGISAVAGVEHVIHAIIDLADEIVVLDRGRVIARGPATDVLRDPAVVEAYLGEELVAP
jgi:ABC-type sugar transport system ATPase subunit